MKKNGFTLIELLGVIVLIALISVLSFPVVLNQIKKSNEQVDKVTTSLVIDSSKMYVNDNLKYFPKVTGGVYCLSIQNLVNSNYLDKTVIDENTNLNKKVVKIEYDTKYDYSIVDSSSCEGNFPVISDNPDKPSYELIFDFDKATHTINGFKSQIDSSSYTNLVIPNTINNVKVKRIDEYAFKSKGLVSVTIPDGITSIGRSAFEGNKLTSVRIPGSVKIIRPLAFANNFDKNVPTIKSIILEEGIEQIQDYAFRNHHVSELVIPGSVYSISTGAFDGTTSATIKSLNDITIKEGTRAKSFTYHIFNGHYPNVKVYVDKNVESNKLINWYFVINNNNSQSKATYCDGTTKTIWIGARLNCIYE